MILAFIFMIASSSLSINAQYLNVDFDISMGKSHPRYDHYYQDLLPHHESMVTLNRFKALYQLNNPETMEFHEKPLIPKIIHQIWLGSPLPEKYKALQATWIAHHPDWEYRIWTEKEIAALELENIEAYNKAINYAERSDIARYEILYRMGGLYVDTDFECIQPFDFFHHRYTFYAGLELPCMATFIAPIMMPNSLIAASPAHPILKGCIDEIFKKTASNSAESDIVVKTGPMLFTKMIIKYIGTQQDHKDIILPSSFIFPIDKNTKDRSAIESCIMPETFGIHHWAGSWILKEEAFVPGIKIRCRQEGNVIRFMIVDERK